MTWALQNSTLYLPTLVLSPSEKQQRFCLASGGKVPELHTERRHDRQSRDKSGFSVSLVLCFNQLVTMWTEIVGSRRSSVWTTLWLCSRNVIPVTSLLCISISHLEAISMSLCLPLELPPLSPSVICLPTSPTPPFSRNLRSLLTLASWNFIWVKWSLELLSAKLFCYHSFASISFIFHYYI